MNNPTVLCIGDGYNDQLMFKVLFYYLIKNLFLIKIQ
jgi:hypothetical protein